MKGLLYKDTVNLWASGKVFILFCLLMLVLSAVQVGEFISFVVILSAVLPITSLSIDERAGWDRYANVLPVSRSAVVVSKYLLGWILVAGTSLLAVASDVVYGTLSGALDVRQLLFGFLFRISLGVGYGTLVYPAIFKFGMEKGKLFYLIVMGAVSGILFSGLIPDEILRNDFPSGGVVFSVFAGSVLLSLLSLWISVFVYRKREF